LVTAAWRSLRLAYRAEPRLLIASFVLTAISWVPLAVVALWLKLLADGAVARNDRQIVVAAAGLAGSVALGWLLRTVSARVDMVMRLRTTVAIESHVARLQAAVVNLELSERSEYLDRLQLLRDQVFLLDHMYGALMGTVGLVVMLAVTIGLLVSIHPALALLAVFAIPAAASGSWRAGAERRARDLSAPHIRLSRHLLDLGTSPAAGKEIRVSRTGEHLTAQRRAAWLASFQILSQARWVSTLWHAGAWLLFSAAYIGAVGLAAIRLRATPGAILLVLAAGGSLARYLAATVETAQFLRWTLDAASRLAWLEDFSRERSEPADRPAPTKIKRGIRLEGVSFRYPGTERLVLEDISIELPAGKVVALVGENGSGKTTLVKLLCRFYEPDSGRIIVDGVDLRRIAAPAWRARVAGAFQDFMRFEFRAQRTVGLGDLPREDLIPAVEAAVARGGASDVIERLPQGLATQLGPTWSDGVDVSFGQWQKLAVARGFMRDEPLLLVLDEPTAALDAETEHALFESFAEQSRAASSRITVLVSHRFSTVRMADLIVVLDGAHVREAGSHDQLMQRNGLYAELYEIQARGYR
jgi:ATP-binding cassette subfamily B protein